MSEELPVTWPLEVQVAGHQCGGLRIRQTEDGRFLLKPIKDEREKTFYERIFNGNEQEESVKKLRPFVAKYFGEFVDDGVICIKLENLIHEYRHPSIVDVKVGRVTSEPSSTLDKAFREIEKYKGTKMELGFCIPGMKIYNRLDNIYVDFNKEYGKSLDVDSVREVLKKFIDIGDPTQTRQLSQEICRQLTNIRDWFTSQNKYHFYSSSLLIIYEIDDIDENTLETKFKADVRLIDFAHVTTSNESLDENYLFGLENLIKTFKEIVQ